MGLDYKLWTQTWKSMNETRNNKQRGPRNMAQPIVLDTWQNSTGEEMLRIWLLGIIPIKDIEEENLEMRGGWWVYSYLKRTYLWKLHRVKEAMRRQEEKNK